MKTATLPGGIEVGYQSTTALEILKREFFQDRTYEDAGIELRDGDVIFDVGANIGFFALYLSRTLRDAKVYCFEPIPETYALLQHNVRQSNLEVQTYNVALADRSGTTTFQYFPRMNVNSSMNADDSPQARHDARQFVLKEIHDRNRLGRFVTRWTPSCLMWPILEVVRRWGTKSVEVECELRTLSSVVEAAFIDQIDLLKIDVEGACEAVLAGIQDHHWPLIRQIMIETHFGPEQARRVADFLQKRGFRTQYSPSIVGIDNLHLVVGVRTVDDPRTVEIAAAVGV